MAKDGGRVAGQCCGALGICISTCLYYHTIICWCIERSRARDSPAAYLTGIGCQFTIQNSRIHRGSCVVQGCWNENQGTWVHKIRGAVAQLARDVSSNPSSENFLCTSYTQVGHHEFTYPFKCRILIGFMMRFSGWWSTAMEGQESAPGKTHISLVVDRRC